MCEMVKLRHAKPEMECHLTICLGFPNYSLTLLVIPNPSFQGMLLNEAEQQCPMNSKVRLLREIERYE